MKSREVWLGRWNLMQETYGVGEHQVQEIQREGNQGFSVAWGGEDLGLWIPSTRAEELIQL